MSRPRTALYALAIVLALGVATPARADVNYDLIEAAYGGQPARVSALLAKGADVNARDEYGYTALMWAAQGGYVLTLKTLLAKGADVNAKEKNGRTALLIATIKGQKKVVEALLAGGADPLARSNDGTSALDYARRRQLRGIITLMEKAPRNRVSVVPTRAPLKFPPGMAPTPKPVVKPIVKPTVYNTPRPMASMAVVRPTAAPIKVANTGEGSPVSAAFRDQVVKQHGMFMDHIGMRNPEALMQKGFNQDLEDKLDHIFHSLAYGTSSTLPRTKLHDARAWVIAAKKLTTQADFQEDKICVQILETLDQQLAGMGY